MITDFSCVLRFNKPHGMLQDNIHTKCEYSTMVSASVFQTEDDSSILFTRSNMVAIVLAV